MVELYNKWHFLLVGISLSAIVLTCLIFAVFLRKKSKWVSWTFILILLIGNLILHFMRFFFPPPGTTYNAIRWITPVSICAVNTLSFTFIFLSESKAFKDYMFYIGLLSGLLAIINPFDIANRYSVNDFETIRFFTTHGILCTSSLLMILCGHHRLNWRRTWKTALVMLGALTIIFLNDIILMSIGIQDYDLDQFFDKDVRNGAMIFGPSRDFGVWSKIFEVLTPEYFKTVPFGPRKGTELYWPIIWLAVPGIIFLTLLCFIISLIFDFRRFSRDMHRLWCTITFQKDKKAKYQKKLERFRR